ncbi:glycosyl hydrolase [Aspergillus cavernicola]|uniref:Glycosyl hydrolase n=1 Tax=Aspergillus cavernicola TaxID=176166 RepID=A0ABR4I9D2_9EURO
MPYKNPILPGSNPDPSIIRVGPDFYLVTSTFEYTPSAPIYHSTDLIRWNLINHALTRPSQLQIQTPEPGGGVWATTIRYHNGVYYVLAGCFGRYRPQDDDRVWPRGFYVSTRDIWDVGGWSEVVWFDQVGFDQDLFWDEDGLVYLSSTVRKTERSLMAEGEVLKKDFAIHVSTVDLESGNATSRPVLIRESDSGVSEGSHIFKRGRFYYLFTAEGGTESGHCEWVCRSEKGPFGPWEVGPGNPLWKNGVQDEIQNTGHADLVEDGEGRWWAVFLGVRPVRKGGKWEESVFGRETFLVPVEWKEDWPVINGGKKITLHNDGPHLYEYEPPVAWRDDFTTPTMQIGWYRKNTPLKKDYTLISSGDYQGTLRLHGSPYTLSTPACPTLFLRKQTHRFCVWETRLSFVPDSANTEAGTVVYMNYFTHVSIGVRLARGNDIEPGKRIIRFTPCNTGGEEIDTALSTSSGDVIFCVECGDQYRFGFREVLPGAEEGEMNWVADVSNKSIVEAPLPVGAPFTGMMLGLYAFGDREAVIRPADFGYAEFRALE